MARFPALVGGVIHATGVLNDPTPPRLVAAFGDESLAGHARIGETPLSDLPTPAASGTVPYSMDSSTNTGIWRSVFVWYVA
jgi:hypothetical protein